MKGIKRTRMTSEFCDSDYIDKLSPADAQWLVQFSREYYSYPSQKQIAIHPKAMGTELRAATRNLAKDVLTNQFHDSVDELYSLPSSTLDPEQALLLREQVAEKIRKKVKRKANQL